MADDVEKLLRFIARRYVAREEVLEIERDATAADEGHEIAADQRRAIQIGEQKATEMADAFREGLRRADAASSPLPHRVPFRYEYGCWQTSRASSLHGYRAVNRRS